MATFTVRGFRKVKEQRFELDIQAEHSGEASAKAEAYLKENDPLTLNKKDVRYKVIESFNKNANIDHDAAVKRAEVGIWYWSLWNEGFRLRVVEVTSDGQLYADIAHNENGKITLIERQFIFSFEKWKKLKKQPAQGDLPKF